MKPFNDLSRQELTELTHEDIERYIDLACAEAGVALLLKEPPTPPTKIIAEDMTVFGVGDLLFQSDDVARAVADFVNGCTGRGELKYLSAPSYRKVWEPATDRVDVSRVVAFSPERAASLRAEIEQAERAKKAYDDDKRRYDEVAHERAAIAREISTAIEDAWSHRRRVEELQRAYARYVELAEGNRLIAARFFEKAYHDARDKVPEAFEGIDRVAPAPAPILMPGPGVAEGDNPF